MKFDCKHFVESILKFLRQINRISDIQLFVHQAVAIEAIRAGHNVAVSTATASGKSLVYNIPVLESIIENNDVVALYLFPTKVSIPTIASIIIYINEFAV